MKLPYKEGTLFAVLLRRGGYAVGVVARTSSGGVILNDFFEPARENVSDLLEVDDLSPHDAILVGRVGDLSLLDKTWPIIGNLRNWKREEWSMPLFVRRDDIMKRAWRVQYSNDNANRVASEGLMDYNLSLEFDRDSVWGAGAAEIRLTKLLTSFTNEPA